MKTFLKVLKWIGIGIAGLFVLFILIGVIALTTGDTVEEAAAKRKLKDPYSIGEDSLQTFVGQSFPYEWARSVGGSSTHDATDYRYWVVKLDSAKISMLVNKENDLVMFAGFGLDAAAEQKNAIVEARDKHLSQFFSAYDGSHVLLSVYLQGQLKDPDSYKHIETSFWDKGNHLVVRTVFSGTNSFGGRVKNTCLAKCDATTGAVLEILSLE